MTPGSAPDPRSDLADLAAIAEPPHGLGHTREGGHNVLRAVDVLTYVAACSDRSAPGVVDIARALGREKSVVSRNLRVLTDAGLLWRDPVGLGYRIGYRLFTIAASAHAGVLAEHAREVVERLSSSSGERVDVLVRDGGTVVTVATAAPATPLQAIGRVGMTYPLMATATGRCFLLDASDDEIEASFLRYGAPATGPASPMGVGPVVAGVRKAREQGWAEAHEEIDRSLSAVAAPVRGADGSVVAVLSVAGPTDRLEENLPALTAQLLEEAASFGTRLGHHPRPGSTVGRPTEEVTR